MKPALPSGPATRSALYLLGLLAALKALSLVLLAQAIASLLAGLAGGSGDWREQLVWGAAGAVLRAAATWGQGVAARRAALGVKEELRARLLEHALRGGGAGAGTPHGSAGSPGSAAPLSDGGLAILATRGLDALDNYYTQFLPALVNCAAIPLLLGARILFADWLSAVVIVLTLPLVPLFMVLIGKHTEDRVRDAQATLRRLSNHILELAKGLPVLVGLGRASEQRAALEDLSTEYRTRTMGTLSTAFLSALALELIATISVAVVAVFIGVRLVHGDMGLEAGLLALILAPDCYLPLRELGTAHHASEEGRDALATTGEVLGVPAGRRLGSESDGTSERDGTQAGSTVAGLAVRGLTVRYAGRPHDAVGPLDFEAPAGLVTALAGPSGCGKSTVLGVLAGTVRDNAADGGNGASVRGSFSGPDAGKLAWVPQHPAMVADTVQAEVRLYLGECGLGDGAEETARDCLAQVAAGHLADKNPAELSPGELRRVAVARGLARLKAGATVLLLDEPTAHLDSVTADAVRAAITGLRGKATVILVAHDAATRGLADHVVELRPSGAGAAVTEAPATAASAREATQRAVAPADAVHRDTATAAGPGPFKALARILAPLGFRFTGAVLLAALAALFAVALSGLSGWLIIRASEQPPILYLLGAIVGVRFFGIGRAVLRYCERLVVHDLVFDAMTRLRGALWASLSQRALSLRRLLRGGNVLGTVVDDVDTLRDLIPRVVLPPLSAFAVAAAAITATALLLPAALPAVVVTAAAALLLAPLAALLADRNAARAEQQLRSLVLRDIAAALDARAELGANGVAGTVLESLAARDRAATAAARRAAWAEGLGQGTVVLACTLGALAAGLAGAGQMRPGGPGAAVLAVIVLMQLALAEPFGAVVPAVRQAPALAAVLRRIAATGALDADPGTDRGPTPVPELPDNRAGLELRGLEARWPGGAPVFSGIDADAAPGRWIAITGPSGAGKSTLLSVLLGFLPPSAGTVRLSGKAAWCPQEAHLFDSTIRGNLLLARPAGKKADETQMHQALAAVGLSTLVAALPDGLDSRIGPSGSFLSGGERQRLAMARTLLSGADVLLLDEPTAHLDAGTAAVMMAELRAGLQDHTVVLVTHNPADIGPGDDRLELAAGRMLVKPATAQ
ncbi:thiol reductant ABC exporter subunit CydD [Arthrobacter celericrescens]|uniref:thiol reductant ABC exporter subunit CydD n=1 Tax=Arthrobacter celericrescens TaxID=2320851 RepID=UPI000EA257A0|nr:thiol reductant ABC exporter subunit CydD [Arthrobacter celericrescens]